MVMEPYTTIHLAADSKSGDLQERINMAISKAAGAGQLLKELSCAICLDFFNDPVILECGHSFCRCCILRNWEENGDDSVGYQCPECRREFPSMNFTSNYQVKNLVERLDELDCLRQCESPTPAIKLEAKCEQHEEALKLFCHTDQRPICVVCRESRDHRDHNMSPIPEVIEDLKADLRMRLDNLNFHRSRYAQVKPIEDQYKWNIQRRKDALKEKIENEVGELVQFLLDEKDELLARLDMEEDECVSVIDENLKKVEREIVDVDMAIANIQRCLSYTSSYEDVSQIASRPYQPLTMRYTSRSPKWEEFSGPLQLILWKKMMHVLHTGPTNLTLDVDTAHPNLVITKHGTTVVESRGRSRDPDLPQKFSHFFGVLASAEFSGGQHYWEVDVRHKGMWYLGVTTKHSNRKGFVNLCPSEGYWSLCCQDQVYANLECTRLPVAKTWTSPRVGVYLDYDGNRVSFYDAVTMKHVYTFETSFTDLICPFFSPGKNNPGSPMYFCHFY